MRGSACAVALGDRRDAGGGATREPAVLGRAPLPAVAQIGTDQRVQGGRHDDRAGAAVAGRGAEDQTTPFPLKKRASLADCRTHGATRTYVEGEAEALRNAFRGR